MDIDRMKTRLEEERRRLVSLRDSHLEDRAGGGSSVEANLDELSSQDQHPAEQATETFEREKDLSVLNQIENDLEDVEDALRRIEEGTYGKCEVCGRPIDEARLEARPQARLCLEDEKRVERSRP
ncbi:MAG TPA: TraR/DksA C4-type zinc finger protein [Actinomycetota bacterium]|jgi:RNA polymerase-binding transcription factor DksA|nr:TraR/DksA C4-type zinc finger protein [Actinomycetota bacterium]